MNQSVRFTQQKKPLILVVDDDAQIRKTHMRVLGNERYEYKTAENGIEALGIYKAGGIDLVISDFNMPRMNGLHLLMELRKYDPSAKVLIVSGGRTKEEIKALTDGGAMEFIQKPYDRHAIIASVERALKTNPVGNELPMHEGLKRTRVLIADDEPDLVRALEIALGTFGYVVNKAQDGAEALEAYRSSGADVIVSDLQMPNLDGIGLVKALREIDPEVKVIITTAIAVPEKLEMVSKAGAFRVMGKPYNIDDLHNAIKDALSK